ncbi:MAG: DNA polymerase III subunit delta', partial [Myxococcota bacterium]
MSFPGVLGHERSLALLDAALKSDRLHHAYLFAGPGGVGKEKVAGVFAQALLCELGDPVAGPCGSC